MSSPVTQLCPTLCDPINCSTPSFPVHHQLLELIQTHVHQVSDAIQLPHPLSSPSPPAFSCSSCPTLCDPMDCSRPGLPVQNQLPEPIQTHVHQVSDAIQPSHPLSSSSPAFNRSQYQCLFRLDSSLHQMAKVLEIQI